MNKTNCTLQSKMNYNPQIDYVTECNHGSSSLKSGDLYRFGLTHCALNCAVVGSRLPHWLLHGAALSHISVTVPLQAVAKDPEGHSPPQALPAGVYSQENQPLLIFPQRVTRNAAAAAAPASAGQKFSNPFGVCWIPGGSSLLNHPHGQSKGSWGRRMGRVLLSG